MDTILRHRYVASLLLAGLFFLVGTAMVINRSAISPGSSMNGLNINGVIQTTDPAVPIPGTPAPIRPSAVDVPFTKVTPPVDTTPKTAPQSDYFDWDSFVSDLSRPAGQTQQPSDFSLSEAYAFVPTELISPEKFQPINSMNASQKALYGWGSDVGSAIQSYENMHPDQPAILTNFIQDRENPDKQAAMKRLAADLQGVGNSIEIIGSHPPQMSTAGPALVEAYRELGRNLALIPDAKGDEALIKAILTYNTSAESFVQKFVNVALIFQANDVKFTQDEPGGVFMFPN